MPIFFAIIAFSISVSMAGLGYAAFIKNKQSTTNGLFFIFSIVLALWCASNFLENWVVSQELATVFLKLDFILGPFVFYTVFLFLLNFPEPNRKLSDYSFWLFFPTLFMSGLTLTDSIIKDINFNNGKIGFSFGSCFGIYAFIILFYLITAIVYQIWQFRKITGTKRMQVKYVLFGVIVVATIDLVFNLFLQNTVSQEIFRIGNFSPVIFIFCIYYAIARYHLMNIGKILRLGAIYTFLIATITLMYALAGYIFISFFNIGEPWSFIIPSFFITFSFLPIKRIIEKTTDNIFFKRQYKFSDVAGQIESDIHEVGLNLDKTLEIINKSITEALKVEHSTILILLPKGHFISRQFIGEGLNNLKLKQNNPIISYLSSYQNNILDKEELEREIYSASSVNLSLIKVVKELNRYDLSLVVPIELKNKLIGVYLLGPKKSQDPYTQEDLKLLRHVAWELGFSIDNANSYEELKRLDDIKSNFISVVSHQLRTPVSITRCNLELYFDADVSSNEKNEAIKDAYEGTLSLDRQLDQLLTVLEIEEKKIALKKTLVKINEVMNRVITDNKINISNKNIKLTFEADKTDTEITCDENKIKKVLDILLVNAISYVFNEGKINISVEKENLNKKTKLIITITDNGIGIAEDSKNEIFKKFFRAPEAVSVSPNGFGLGLFIAKKIVDAHNGEIVFETNEGKGVTFFLTLPIK